MQVIQTNLSYTKPLIPLALDNIIHIVVHHAEASRASVYDIHKWHLQNGWSGFGYNEYILKDGTVYIGRGDHIGAQCQNWNSKSYGICCEGNYAIEDMPEAQFNSLVERIKYNSARFPNYQDTKKHGELNNTACPGTKFPWANLLNGLVEEVRTMGENQKHWAQDSYDYLKTKGVVINETRFDDKITRGEMFALLAQILNNKEA